MFRMIDSKREIVDRMYSRDWSRKKTRKHVVFDPIFFLLFRASLRQTYSKKRKKEYGQTVRKQDEFRL